MKIGFDGKRAINNMTGLGNYSRLVIESLSETYPNDRMIVYAPKIRENPRLSSILERENVEFRMPERNSLGALWRTFGISRLLKPDGIEIYHGLSNELPLNIRQSGVPSVVTVHDVIYRTMPECYSWFDRMMYDFKYGMSCRNADRIIAISECTKRDIVRFYGVDPDKIDVVYQGCDDIFSNLLTDDELQGVRRGLLLPEKFIVQVGTIEKRKNLELAVKALPQLPSDVKLVVVGRNRGGYKEYAEGIAERLGVRDRLVFPESVPFKLLPGVYQLAEASVYPSFYEGFGIPIIESLSSGCPVVAATGSCLEEAGGDGAIYVDPRDPREFAEALNVVLRRKEKREDMIARGLEYVKRFDNSTMSFRIMEVYRSVLKKKKRR